MERRSHSKGRNSRTSCLTSGGTAIAALVVVFAASFAVQAQQSSSLADAARQARAQKQGQPKADNSQAQQVADQLAEDQTSGDAPAGFKTFNAGDYRVWVPAPYTVDGHDDGGTVLTGPSVGSKRAVVLLGTPIVFPWGNSDTAFHGIATQFASLYLDSAKCTKTKVVDHDAYQCGLAGAHLMGRNVSGNAMFVRVSDAIYPVFCTAPTDSHERDILNDPHSSYEDKLYARRALDREEVDVRSVWQKCETVFQSIHVKNSIRKTAGDSSGPAEKVSSGGEGEAAAAGGAGSLADIAKRIHQAPGQVAVLPTPLPSPASTNAETESAVPAGFKVHAFNYCRSATQCWNASVIVPSAAQLVSSTCKQYIFETKVQGTPLLLLAGASGNDRCDGLSANDPSLVHWNALVDPETKRAPGTFVTISSLQVKLDGQPAVITTMGLKRGMADWMGKRAEIEANGVSLVVGCLAPREHFSDSEDVCSALIESLRLP